MGRGWWKVEGGGDGQKLVETCWGEGGLLVEPFYWRGRGDCRWRRLLEGVRGLLEENFMVESFVEG